MHKLTDKYKYIIFDFDGTLNNSSPGIFATFKKVLDHFGVDYSHIDFAKHIGPPLEYSYEHFVGKDRMNDAIQWHYKVYAEDHAAQNSFLYDGIPETLQQLKAHGYNTNRLRKEKLLSEGVLQSLRTKSYISMDNLAKLCALLDCQPSDLIAYEKEASEGVE